MVHGVHANHGVALLQRDPLAGIQIKVLEFEHQRSRMALEQDFTILVELGQAVKLVGNVLLVRFVIEIGYYHRLGLVSGIKNAAN